MKSLLLFFESEDYFTPQNLRLVDLIGTQDTVKRAIQLAKKGFQGSLSDTETNELKRLFKDSNVQTLIDAAEKVARNNKWICPKFIGGLTGGLTQIAFGKYINTTPVTMYALILLGAKLGSVDVGVSTSDLVDTLQRYKIQDAPSDYTTTIDQDTLSKLNDF